MYIWGLFYCLSLLHTLAPRSECSVNRHSVFELLQRNNAAGEQNASLLLCRKILIKPAFQIIKLIRQFFTQLRLIVLLSDICHLI